MQVSHVRLVTPIPPVPEARHGGLKLDRRSDVGRRGAMLGWETPVPPSDAGMPADVARMLAEGLCAVATVTGCTIGLPADVGPAWTPVPGGHGCRFRAHWWRRSRDELGLLASRTPDVVARLFDDDGFVWSHESQLLLLSPPDVLPALDRELVNACFDVPMRVTGEQLARAGVVGLVRAGVDGDVAGLYVPEPTWREAVVSAIATAVAGAGARWEERDGAYDDAPDATPSLR